MELTAKKQTKVLTSAKLTDFFCAISIVLSIFFNQYVFFAGISLGELLLIISSVFIFFKNNLRCKTRYCLPIVFIYFYSLLLSFIYFVDPNISFEWADKITVVTRWIRYFAYLVFIITYTNWFNKASLAIKIYKIVVIFVSIYTLLQFIFFSFFNIMLPIDILPFFKMSRDLSSVFANYTSVSYRGYGVFMEPSYLAKFLLPSIPILMWQIKQKKRVIIQLCLVFGAIICSTSMQGVVIALIIIVVFIFFGNGKINMNTIFKRAVLFGLFSLIFFVLLNHFNLFSRVLTRFSNITSSDTKDYSTGMRIYRGFSIFNSLSIHGKLFGIGFGNMANYIYSYGIVTPYDYYIQNEASIEYMNGLSSLLVQTGIVGFIIFISFSLKTFFKCSIIGKMILIEFILIMLTGSDLFSITTAFFMFFIFLFRKREIAYGIY
jgi:hypothetical protein